MEGIPKETIINVNVPKDAIEDQTKVELTGTKEFEFINNSLLFAKGNLINILNDKRIPLVVREEYKNKLSKLFS